MMSEFQLVPWPMNFGDVRNTSRSSFNGPPGTLIDAVTIDSWEYDYDDVTSEGKHIDGLLFPDNVHVIYLDHPSLIIKCVHTSQPDRIAWYKESGSTKPPCIAPDGTMYYINKDRNRLVCCSSTTGREYWWQPLADTSGNAASVELAGKYIYVSIYFADTGNSSLSAYDWDRDISNPDDRRGQFLWEYDQLFSRLEGIAEDIPRDAVYVFTYFNLYTLDLDGRFKWFMRDSGTTCRRRRCRGFSPR